MKFSATAALATLASIAVASPVAVNGAPPSGVTIRNVKYNGSGCPQNSVVPILADDKQSFTLLMSEYVAAIGPGVSPKENFKNCQINIDLTWPGGYQFTIFDATYRGGARLDAGISGTQTAIYYFTGGGSQQCTASTTLRGPVEKQYTITDKIGVESWVWSPCGAKGYLNINSILRMGKTGNAKPEASGVLTTDSVDGTFKSIYSIQWRQCKQ